MSDGNVLKEYYKIFGHRIYPNLYMADDEEYSAFRQQIINAPCPKEVYNKYPFEGICLKSTSNVINPLAVDDRFGFIISNKILANIIEALLINKISMFSPIFYIKKGNNINARGYFDSTTKYFHILPMSTVALTTSESLSPVFYKKRERFLAEACKKGEHCYRVIKDAPCISALAASNYVLGNNFNKSFWIDVKGRSFEYYFPL